jgi:hypothetical protein
MIYRKVPESSLIEVDFVETHEVEVISAAVVAHNQTLRDKGNDSSVHPFHNAMEKWQNAPQRFRGTRIDKVVDSLKDYAETTEADGDSFLDEFLDIERIAKAGRRYRLGYTAQAMLEDLQRQAQVSEIDA